MEMPRISCNTNRGLNPIIVVVGYKRKTSLMRLLHSLTIARYPSNEKIRLIISLDGGANKDVVEAAKEFIWPFGEIELITNQNNLGLRKHIIQCASLSLQYGSVILLEDDLYVSPYFYLGCKKLISKYGEDEKISQIGLYSFAKNQFALWAPFHPIPDNNDVIFMQTATSWGQAWTASMWERFLTWYRFYENSQSICDVRLPELVLSWPESSWKKYYNAFLVSTDTFTVYPKISLTTNVGVPGTHVKTTTKKLDVVLANSDLLTRMPSISENVVLYDAFMEPLLASIPDLSKAGIDIENSFCDLFGIKDQRFMSGKKVLTIKKSIQPLKSFANELSPPLLNVLCNVKGTGITYCPADSIMHGNYATERIIEKEIEYFSCRIQYRALLKKILAIIKSKSFIHR